jgi:hypothetical protein
MREIDYMNTDTNNIVNPLKINTHKELEMLPAKKFDVLQQKCGNNIFLQANCFCDNHGVTVSQCGQHGRPAKTCVIAFVQCIFVVSQPCAATAITTNLGSSSHECS